MKFVINEREKNLQRFDSVRSERIKILLKIFPISLLEKFLRGSFLWNLKNNEFLSPFHIFKKKTQDFERNRKLSQDKKASNHWRMTIKICFSWKDLFVFVDEIFSLSSSQIIWISLKYSQYSIFSVKKNPLLNFHWAKKIELCLFLPLDKEKQTGTNKIILLSFFQFDSKPQRLDSLNKSIVRSQNLRKTINI